MLLYKQTSSLCCWHFCLLFKGSVLNPWNIVFYPQQRSRSRSLYKGKLCVVQCKKGKITISSSLSYNLYIIISVIISWSSKWGPTFSLKGKYLNHEHFKREKGKIVAARGKIHFFWRRIVSPTPTAHSTHLL